MANLFTITEGSSVITLTDPSALPNNLEIGYGLSGDGIVPGSEIRSIDSSVQITMNQNASDSVVDSLVDFEEVPWTEVIESTIVYVLDSVLDSVSVSKYPNYPDTLSMSNPNGTILVHFSGKQNSHSGQGIPMMRKQQTVSFEIYVYSRTLRGNHGIHKLSELVAEVLSRTRISNGWSRIIENSTIFSGYENGIWSYIVSVSISGIL